MPVRFGCEFEAFARLSRQSRTALRGYLTPEINGTEQHGQSVMVENAFDSHGVICLQSFGVAVTPSCGPEYLTDNLVGSGPGSVGRMKVLTAIGFGL